MSPSHGTQNTGTDSDIALPEVSICICNYNMSDTIGISLASILDQIDERFEIVLVDDGSTDPSWPVIQSLSANHPQLRAFRLARDSKRKLGLTRNYSIQEARGQLVILHLDTDDVCGPFITDFVEIYKRLRIAIGRDFFLSGQHIHIASREFLLQRGPFKNIYRGEDRELWTRLAAESSLLLLRHVRFISQIPRLRRTMIRKIVWDNWDQAVNDLRQGTGFLDALQSLVQDKKRFGVRLRLFRLAILGPAWLAAQRAGKITRLPQSPAVEFDQPLATYRERNSGDYLELMKRWGGNPQTDFLSKRGREIFLMTQTAEPHDAAVNAPRHL